MKPFGKIVLQSTFKSVTIWLQTKTMRNKLHKEETRDMHKHLLSLMLCLTLFGSLSTMALAAEETAEDAGTAFLFEKAPAEKPLPGAKPACPGRSTPAGQEDSGPVII